MKKLLAGILAVCLVFSVTACSGGDGDSGSGGDEGIVGRVDKMLSAQGRSYDELVTGKVGETLTCTFFDFKITNVQAADELDGNVPNTEGNKFITADVEVKNIMDEDIPVGNYDFNIIWETEAETAEEDHWAYTSFMDGMYPDDVMLAPEDSLSGKLVFEVPADVNTFGIEYAEIYDDEFQGDSYVVECAL